MIAKKTRIGEVVQAVLDRSSCDVGDDRIARDQYFVEHTVELAQEVKRLTGLLTGDPTVASMHLEKGCLDMSMRHPAAQILAGAFASELLKHPEAKNFMEITFHHQQSGQDIVVTVHRPGGKTPSQLLSETQDQFKKVTERHDKCFAALRAEQESTARKAREMAEAMAGDYARGRRDAVADMTHPCTCGSGAHPRECKRHAWAYQSHIDEMGLESAVEEVQETLSAMVALHPEQCACETCVSVDHALDVIAEALRQEPKSGGQDGDC